MRIAGLLLLVNTERVSVGANQDVAALLEQAEPAIRFAVRRKLHTTLRADDQREANLDALDLLSEIRLRLVRRLRQPEGEAVDDWAAYAAMTAYHACNDYLRSKYPRRARLKNVLRRLFEKLDGYSIWENAHGELHCGWSGQRETLPNTDAIARLTRDPGKLASYASRVHPGDLQPAPLAQLLEAILKAAQGPMSLDSLIAIVAKAIGMEEACLTPMIEDSDGAGLDPAETLAAPEPDAESRWMMTERLKLLWGAILQLLPHHRAAYLLNLRDGGLDVFPFHGVASIERIGEAIGLNDAQYQALARELQWNEQALAEASILPGAQKFLICWRYLPLEDILIGLVLGVSRMQIINYRNKGIERLRRLLGGVQ